MTCERVVDFVYWSLCLLDRWEKEPKLVFLAVVVYYSSPREAFYR